MWHCLQNWFLFKFLTKPLVCLILKKYVSLLLQQLTQYKIPNRPLQLYLTRSVGNSVKGVRSDTGMLQDLYLLVSPKYFGSNDAWLCVLASGWNTLKWHTCLQRLVMQINWWDFLFAVTSTHITHPVLNRVCLCSKYWADILFTHSCTHTVAERSLHKVYTNY